MEVAIVQVVPEHRKVVVSQRQALEWRSKRVLQLGNVLSGTVKAVHPFGAFIQLDALPYQDALLHAESITQVQRPHDVRVGG
jgi:ribosomal protein S1